uniref:Uncharacterized protein n=1 Tax=Geospiza parvula TaxID=87175 RepID=A0A8C3MKG3_GEOPR
MYSVICKTGDFFTYDAAFGIPEDYDQYLPRCDRKHAKARGLKINEEEMARTVPVLTSSEYGKRIDKLLDPPTREHARVHSLSCTFSHVNSNACLLLTFS